MKKKLLVLGLVCVLLLVLGGGAGAIWVQQQLQPVESSVDSVEDQRFVIKKGESVSSVANRLHAAGLIRNPRVFSYMVRFYKLTPQIQAGSFTLSPSQSSKAIAETFTKGTEDVWITLLEGWRVEEIADHIAAQEDLTDFDKDNFLFLADSLEGTLYPDTYLVPKEIDEKTLISLLTNTFETKTSEEFEAAGITPDESSRTLVMASLVQREAKSYEDMRRVAGILANRVEIGMPLQVDATLQYAKAAQEYQKIMAQGSEVDALDFDWWATPLSADKDVVSPFNTYKNNGLPPSPICNPGLDAIKATLDPLESEDLYYIHAMDGNMYYADTLDKHNENINRYLR